ncbi:MAG: YdeI/OmpD-associated family protein [Clostridia bacterium]|nr:YdeI/OmpD-associated family protein [Clostridia bacterium]
MTNKVEIYLSQLKLWEPELRLLRDFTLDCELEETFKRKHPCYMNDGKNIIILQEFKAYCAILFLKGVLLKDPNQMLVKLTENVQSDRQLRFTSLEEILEKESIIKSYILEAIEIEKQGLVVEKKETSDYEMPEELKIAFEEDENFKVQFEALTPGRQRGYLLHFSQGKQAKTRLERIEKSKNRIALGKGVDECICGMSKHKPRCDGSHKKITTNSQCK